MRTQLASSDSARIYGACGGAYNQYDARACAVPQFQLRAAVGLGVYGNVATSAASAINIPLSGCDVGIVQDSGIAERSKSLYFSATDHTADFVAHGAAAVPLPAGNTRTIWVSYPIPVPPMNPWHGYVLPASCPYKNCPLAIPHLSAGGLDFLMEDFAAGFIRRLGSQVFARGAEPAGQVSGRTPAY